MKLTLRSAAGWLPLLVIVVGLSACGGGGSSGGGGSGGPPPPPATPPPSGLSYPTPPNYAVGTVITPLDPSVTGTVRTYGVSPDLPAGLSFDTTTGRISGTPTVPWRAKHTVTATNAAGNTTFALTIAVVTERSTTDRADEAAGRQVHVMYAVPSDGVDEQFDQTATLEQSLKIANEWFKTQTGGTGVRFDTYGGGKLDATFIKLSKTDAEMAVSGGNVRSKLEYLLYANGFNSADKVYLVYYSGDGDGCGRGAWPPTLHGNVAAVYVGATSGCTNQPFAVGTQLPGFLEFMAMHEVLHVLGFAAPCAPNQSGSGHVKDGAQDLMWSSTPGSSLWKPSTLDVNHDDYYGSAVPGCRDLANSAFLEPLPAGPEAPPGWPYANLTSLAVPPGCSNEITTIPGPDTGVTSQVTFVNTYKIGGAGGTPTVVTIWERVPDPALPGNYKREFRIEIPYNDGAELPAKENAIFVATYPQTTARCAGFIRAKANPARWLIVP